MGTIKIAPSLDEWTYTDTANTYEADFNNCHIKFVASLNYKVEDMKHALSTAIAMASYFDQLQGMFERAGIKGTFYNTKNN